MKFSMRLLTLFLVFCLAVTMSPSAYAQGVLFRGIGAVNEGFGSASTAAPLDAAGAIYWNPASISGLKHSEMQFGLGIVMSTTEMSWENSFTSNLGGTASGSTKGSAGAVPSPNAAMVWKTPNKRLTLGFMFAGVGGASTMYPYDANNPLMLKPESNPLGIEAVRTSNVQIIQALPTASYQLTRRLSVGLTPVLGMGKLEIHPSAIAGSDEPTGTRYLWGGGVNAGLFYQADNCFNYGFTIKSPVWIEHVRVYDSNGSHSLDLDLPLILSWGLSYTGFRNTILAVDLRYFDWGNTNGFRDVGIENYGTPEERFVGLGWKSIFSVACGVERKINNRLKLRAGYCFNENPVPDRNSLYNTAAPLIMEHVLSFGGSWTFAREWDMALAYSHAFSNKITGPLDPSGTYPGTISSEAGAGILNASVIKRF